MATSNITISPRLVPVKQYVTPTTGSTVTVNSDGYIRLFVSPSGTIATLTISLPSSPTDQDTVELSSTQIVTSLTMSNGTISGALTTMAVATFAKYVYVSDSTTWYRVG